VVSELVLFGQGTQTYEQLAGDLSEVVEDEGDALEHGIHERSLDVLELSELFFADEVAE